MAKNTKPQEEPKEPEAEVQEVQPEAEKKVQPAKTVAPVEPKEKPITAGVYKMILNVQHDNVAYQKDTFVELDKGLAKLFVEKGWSEPTE